MEKSLKDDEFIKTLYSNLFNKTKTDVLDGIKYWVNEKENGISDFRGEVVAEIVKAVEDYADSEDQKTKAAYEQFVNRVAVSDYTADNVLKSPMTKNNPTLYKKELGFKTPLNPDGKLEVTAEPTTVNNAKYYIKTSVKLSNKNDEISLILKGIGEKNDGNTTYTKINIDEIEKINIETDEKKNYINLSGLTDTNDIVVNGNS